MKITKIEGNKRVFSPYVKIIEILVESNEDELLLGKLKDYKDIIFLSDAKGSVISDNLNFTSTQEESASELLKDILSNL